VNNIIKHSHATKASLFIRRDSDELILLIQDNGQGFAQNENKVNETKHGGFGLMGIAERVKMLSGSYKIDSTVGQGTTIRIRINTNKSISPAKTSAGV